MFESRVEGAPDDAPDHRLPIDFEQQLVDGRAHSPRCSCSEHDTGYARSSALGRRRYAARVITRSRHGSVRADRATTARGVRCAP